MPQLDLSTYFSQIVWLVLSFGFLWAITGLWIVPRFRKIVGARNHHLQQLHQQALELQKKSQELHNVYDAALNRAKDNASRLLAEARQKAEEELLAHKQKLTENVQEKFVQAERELRHQGKEFEDYLSHQMENLEEEVWGLLEKRPFQVQSKGVSKDETFMRSSAAESLPLESNSPLRKVTVLKRRTGLKASARATGDLPDPLAAGVPSVRAKRTRSSGVSAKMASAVTAADETVVNTKRRKTKTTQEKVPAVLTAKPRASRKAPTQAPQV